MHVPVAKHAQVGTNARVKFLGTFRDKLGLGLGDGRPVGRPSATDEPPLLGPMTQFLLLFAHKGLPLIARNGILPVSQNGAHQKQHLHRCRVLSSASMALDVHVSASSSSVPLHSSLSHLHTLRPASVPCLFLIRRLPFCPSVIRICTPKRNDVRHKRCHLQLLLPTLRRSNAMLVCCFLTGRSSRQENLPLNIRNHQLFSELRRCAVLLGSISANTTASCPPRRFHFFLRRYRS